MQICLLVLIILVYYSNSALGYLSPGEKIVSGRLGRIYESYFIEINVGYRGETLFEIIDQEIAYTYTTTNYFNLHNSGSMSIISNKSIMINNTLYDELEINDTLYFQEENIANKMTFKYLNISFTTFVKEHGAYGLGLIMNNDSFVQQLYDTQVIDRLCYAIMPFKPFNLYGRVYFGGIPKRIIKQAQTGQCKVNSNTKWGCKLSRVYTDDGLIDYHNKDESYFQAKEPFIIAPKDFVLMLYERILKEYVANNTCEEVINMNYSHYRLNNTILDHMPNPNISFVFDNTVITFPLNDTFIKLNYNQIDLAIKYRIDTSDNNWVFGSSFLEQIVTLFDYENKTISFYSNDRVTTLNALIDIKSNKSIILNLLWLSLSLMTIGTVMQLYYKRKDYVVM